MVILPRLNGVCLGVGDPEVLQTGTRSHLVLPVSRSWKAGWRFALLGKAILCPGVGRVGVAANFPKTQDIPVQKSDLPNEFGAFPGVTFGNDNPCRASVVGGDLPAIPLMGD